MVRFSSVVAILATASTASAFTPVSTRNIGSKSSFVPRHGMPVDTPNFRSTTALSMNLFDRFSRVAKSNLNNILRQLEDPEKIMSQALEDMQVLDHCLSILWLGSRVLDFHSFKNLKSRVISGADSR